MTELQNGSQQKCNLADKIRMLPVILKFLAQTLLFLVFTEIASAAKAGKKPAQPPAQKEAPGGTIFYIKGPKDQDFELRSTLPLKKPEDFASAILLDKKTTKTLRDDDPDPPLLLDDVKE